MSGFAENLLQDAAGAFFGSDYLRDYNHASKTFRTNFYQYSPKLKFLFHTYFDINTQAYNQNVGTGANFGLAVKTVQLPKFTFDTFALNQYNRKRIVQTKIKYQPITITFHDDNGTAINTPGQGGIIRNLWQAYYTYYYKDGTKPKVVFQGARGGAPASTTAGGGVNAGPTLADYNTRTQYLKSTTGNDNWGYIGETSVPSGPSPIKIPFFKNITIFGFNQHNFVAYTLINPIITAFNHDTYAYADGAGTMENSMTLDYETVVYNTGAMSGKAPGDIVTGFGDERTYDRRLSPIAKPGSNETITGQGGLMDALNGAVGDIENDNLIGAIQKVGTAYNTFKNKDIKLTIKQELLTGAQNVLNSTPNTTRNAQVAAPVTTMTPTTTGAGSATVSQGQATLGTSYAGRVTNTGTQTL